MSLLKDRFSRLYVCMHIPPIHMYITNIIKETETINLSAEEHGRSLRKTNRF